MHVILYPYCKIIKIRFKWTSEYRLHFHSPGMLKYLQTRLGLVQMSFPTIQCISLHPGIGFDGYIC